MFRANRKTLSLIQSRIGHHQMRSLTTISSVDTKSDQYQYLQKSITPMMHFQPSLPRLPIPDLEKTCVRYLAAQRPLLSDADYETTERLVAEFQKTDGPTLHQLLKANDKKNKHTSYISGPWFDMYLSDRAPLPINYTPVMVMKADPRPQYNELLLRTTNLVLSTLRFRRSLVTCLLKPEVYHMNAKKSDSPLYHTVTRLSPAQISTYVSYLFNAFPLDMSQYQGLFGSTRIPEKVKDRIYQQPDTRHVAILRNGHFYAVDVLDEQGNIESPAIIMGRLNEIITSNRLPAEYPLGVLSSENRDTWAALRKHLISIGDNEKALLSIDSALFCLCLDETTLDNENPVPMIREMLSGDATNRWFDKSFSLTVAKDGTAAVSFEHSWGDGVAVLRYFNETYNETINSPIVHPGTKPDNVTGGTVRSIDFTLDDHMRLGINTARNNHAAVMRSLGTHFFIYHGMNKHVCKQYGLSPDSIMQLGFQLAFWKQYGRYVASYESCSTAAFRHGRTETIRPCTIATKSFCDAVTAKVRPGIAELRAMIDQCSKTHGALTKEAAMGQGFDRHLFGMRYMAQMHDRPTSKIFQDPAYDRINKNIISTSTLTSPGLFSGGFGPVVKDGYGIAYSIQEEMLGAVVTSYPEFRDGAGFIDCLQESFDTIKKIVKESGQKSN